MRTKTKTHNNHLPSIRRLAIFGKEVVRRDWNLNTPRVTVEERAIFDKLDGDRIRSIVKAERSSFATRAGQEGIREDSLKSVPMGVYTPLDGKADEHSGRGEDAMGVNKSAPPEVAKKFTEGFEDFNDPPLWGQDPKELEREFGVTIKILDEKPDELSGSYAIRVSGSLAAVHAFSKAFYSHPPPGVSRVR